MTRTVVFNFSDDFKFPERFSDEACSGCDLKTYDGEGGDMCFLTQEGDYPRLPSKIQCPFFGGKMSVILDEKETAGS